MTNHEGAKVAIDDAMVERGVAAHCCANPECIRKVLEAALNPPPDPEIAVSQAMLDAGNEAWNLHAIVLPGCSARSDACDSIIRAIYRAMHKVWERERRKAEPAQCEHVWKDGTWTQTPSFVNGYTTSWTPEILHRCDKCGATR